MPVDKLPTAWRPTAYRLRNFLLSDATAVGILGVGITAWGVGEIPHRNLAALGIVMGVVVAVLPILWGPRGENAGLIVGVMLNFGLACHSAISHILGGTPAGSPGVAHFSVVVLVMWAVWRGKRGDLPMPGEGRRRV